MTTTPPTPNDPTYTPLTEHQIQRLNRLVIDLRRDGGDITMIGSALLAGAVEIFAVDLLCTDEQITRLVNILLLDILKIVRDPANKEHALTWSTAFGGKYHCSCGALFTSQNPDDEMAEHVAMMSVS